MDSNPDPNALVPQQLVVRLHDGRELHWACQSMLASAERPLTQEQHLAKFRRCCTFAERPWKETETEALIECVDQLETLGDVRVLAQILG
jgi:hypothetical protein